jgi:F-type H+-transporting ATPase subunit gamma
MPKARNILKKSKAVKNIRRVTRTMEMVASTRFKTQHKRTVNLRPYTDAMSEMVGDLIDRGAFVKLHHPLLVEPEVDKDALLIITSNRGLCGPYNSSVVKIGTERYAQLINAGYQVELHVVGRIGRRQLSERKITPDFYYDDFDEMPDYEQVRNLTEKLQGQFLAGDIGGLEIAYTQFLSSAGRRPVISQILPLSNLPKPKRLRHMGEPAKYEIVPSARQLLEKLLPATIRLRVWQCFLDSAICEQFERLSAMRAATESADEMIQKMTIRYNRLRQSQITNELAEILGGRVGVK